MLIIIGTIVVFCSVFGGFALSGGHLGAMYQPLELLIIAGAAAGSFIVGNDTKAIKATLGAIPGAFRSSHYNKTVYLELMALLYELLNKIKKEGLMSIESDVETPLESAIFNKYPKILNDRHAVTFMADYLRLMINCKLNAFEIENLMDNEIDTHHHEGEVPVQIIQKMADALPAFGIVAAVMGVVHTMESVGLPPAELGVLIARALVGTFLGILLAYGMFAPLSSALQHKVNESTKFYQCIKVTLLASLTGYAPQIAVEFGRKVLYSTERPTFVELEEHVRESARS